MAQGNGRAKRIAVVTGASAGMGAAMVRSLAREGFTVIAGARRRERLEDLAKETAGEAHALDVTDPESIKAFAEAIEARHDHVDVLVNNAGKALGFGPLPETSDDDWMTIFETNVLGIVRMVRALMPLMRKAPHSHIVNIGSVAGFDVYAGGTPYISSKHAVRAITNGLRLELNGEPIRVTEIAPGMTRTEFSSVRFGGDEQRAEKVYEGLTPLTAEDIAECVTFVVTRPPHVNIDYVVVRPVDQATSFKTHRRKAAEAAR